MFYTFWRLSIGFKILRDISECDRLNLSEVDNEFPGQPVHLHLLGDGVLPGLGLGVALQPGQLL